MFSTSLQNVLIIFWKKPTTLLVFSVWAKYMQVIPRWPQSTAEADSSLAGAKSTLAIPGSHTKKVWRRCNSSSGCVLQSPSFLSPSFPYFTGVWRMLFRSFTAFSYLLQKFHFPRQTENNVKFPRLNILSIPQLHGHLEKKNKSKNNPFSLRIFHF